MRARHLIPLFSLLGMTAAAPAQAEPPADPKGRYSMSPVDGGFLRLDTETGAVALCVEKDAKWACEPVKDGATTSATDLEAENKALKDRVKALEDAKRIPPPAAGNEYPTEPPAGSVSQLPTEEEVDKAFDYIEGMYKKLRDRIKKFETEPGSPPGAKPKTKPDDSSSEGGSGAL